MGEQAIDGFILERQSEELFLDFKRSSDNGAGDRLSDRDRDNLAKAISGFISPAPLKRFNVIDYISRTYSRPFTC